MKSVRGVFIKPTEAQYSIETVKGDAYNGIKALVGSRLLESNTYRFGKTLHDIVCDEEGYYAFEGGQSDVSAIDSEQRFCAFGNIFICNVNDEGEWTSLSDTEIREIVGCLRYARKKDGKTVMMALVEYPYWEEQKALREQAEREGWGIIEP